MMLAALFACSVAAVTDGDTFVCVDGTRVRLAAVDAPEMRSCRRGRTCAPGDPVKSRDALAKLAMGKRLSCSRTGKSWGRVTAWCRLPNGGDLSCLQYRRGFAIRLSQFDPQRRLCR